MEMIRIEYGSLSTKVCITATIPVRSVVPNKQNPWPPSWGSTPTGNHGPPPVLFTLGVYLSTGNQAPCGMSNVQEKARCDLPIPATLLLKARDRLYSSVNREHHCHVLAPEADI